MRYGFEDREIQPFVPDRAVDLTQTEAISKKIDFAQAQLERAYAHYKAGEPAQAQATLDRFIKLHPNHPKVVYASYMVAEAFNGQMPGDWFMLPPSYERELASARDAATGMCMGSPLRAEIEAHGAGGLSGAPLRRRSLEVLRLLRERVGDRLVLVSVGGVTTAEDVQERLDAGATLVQGYTAFLYEGPFWARRINQGLARRAGRARPRSAACPL